MLADLELEPRTRNDSGNLGIVSGTPWCTLKEAGDMVD